MDASRRTSDADPMRRITLGEDQFWTVPALAADLCALGLGPGDAVMVHASLRRVGPVLGGADGVIAALRHVVGDEGCILAYVSWLEQYEDALDADGRLDPALKPFIPAFDTATSRANPDHGWFAEALRTTSGAVRSGNPGASVAALGARAREFTDNQPMDYGYGAGSPFARLVAAGGKVLMLGAPLDTMSLLHHAEHLADIPGKHVRRIEVPLTTPDGVTWRLIEEFDTVDPVVDGLDDDYFAAIVDAFLESGQGARGRVGDAPSVLVPAAAMTRFAVDWLEARFRA
jgi:aminoglycoside 3-N-acetyltransferase